MNLDIRIWWKWQKPPQMMNMEDSFLFSGNKSFKEVISYINSDGYDDSAWEVMHYTGLNDRKGIKIYEGDIISIRSNKKPGYNTLIKKEIVFLHGAFCTREIGEELNWERDYGMPGNCLGIGNPWIIIGNIYQNKELLKARDS